MCATARPWIVRILGVVVFCMFLSAGQYARADLFTVTITGIPPSGDAYNGQWVFNVSLNAAKDMVLLTVVSGNNASKISTYNGVTYSFPASIAEGNGYIFSGTFLSNPARGHYNLGASGVYDPVAHTLTLNNPITSQLTRADGKTVGPVYKFEWKNIKAVPEPSSLVITLVSAGVAGMGLTLRRRFGRYAT